MGDFILSYFDSFMNYKVMQLPASMIPPIKSPAILLGTEVTRSPEFRVKRNDFQNHTIYVEMKHIPCLFLCQTYGIERFFFKPSEEKKKVTLISRLIYTSFPVFYVETFWNSQFPY